MVIGSGLLELALVVGSSKACDGGVYWRFWRCWLNGKNASHGSCASWYRKSVKSGFSSLMIMPVDLGFEIAEGVGIMMISCCGPREV